MLTKMKSALDILKSGLVKSGVWLRILDENHNLSLTNAAFLLVLVHIGLQSQLGAYEVLGLLIAVAAYTGKKLIQAMPKARASLTSSQYDHVQTQIEDLQSKIGGLAMQKGLRR